MTKPVQARLSHSAALVSRVRFWIKCGTLPAGNTELECSALQDHVALRRIRTRDYLKDAPDLGIRDLRVDVIRQASSTILRLKRAEFGILRETTKQLEIVLRSSLACWGRSRGCRGG